jgi:hypothetical protein
VAKVGYKNPPKEHQFKSGVSGNPKGRPKRDPAAVSNVIKNTLDATIQYVERGRTKTITRTEVGLKKLVQNAVNGDLKAADALLEGRMHAGRHGDAAIETIEILNSLDSYADQTAQEKSEESDDGLPKESPPAPP